MSDAIATALCLLVVVILFVAAGCFIVLISFAAQFEEARREAEEKGQSFDEQATTDRLLEEMARAFRQNPWPFGPTNPGSF